MPTNIFARRRPGSISRNLGSPISTGVHYALKDRWTCQRRALRSRDNLRPSGASPQRQRRRLECWAYSAKFCAVGCCQQNRLEVFKLTVIPRLEFFVLHGSNASVSGELTGIREQRGVAPHSDRTNPSPETAGGFRPTDVLSSGQTGAKTVSNRCRIWHRVPDDTSPSLKACQVGPRPS